MWWCSCSRRSARDWLGHPYRIGDDDVDISAQSGMSLFPHDASDPETLLQNAEIALKRARSHGERMVFFTPEISQRIAERRSLEARLRRALENSEFVLHYQPKVDLEERKLQGVEALIRWNSPELGLVPPAQVHPVDGRERDDRGGRDMGAAGSRAAARRAGWPRD